MIRSQLLSAWGLSPDGSNMLQVALDYPCTCVDVTGQPAASIQPAPNLCVADIVMTDVTFATLSADPRYADAILWEEVV